MTEDHRYRLIFEEFLDKTEDGFIVVDKDGIITDINQNYCDFLAKRQEDVIGKPIGQVITTTSMYDVLARRHRGDGSNGVYIQPYCAGETRDQSENYAVANRFCFFDEDSTLLGAAAHMKFRQRAMDTAKEILDLELKYYREEYSKSTSGSGGFEHLIGKDPKLLEDTIRTHGLIAEGICANDPQKAYDSMYEHVSENSESIEIVRRMSMEQNQNRDN